jgi:hypothetical protein
MVAHSFVIKKFACFQEKYAHQIFVHFNQTISINFHANLHLGFLKKLQADLHFGCFSALS